MEFLVKPWDHQLKAIELADTEPQARMPNLALFFEMGTGKTGTLINILRKHFARAKRVKRTIILGPVITMRNWKNEFKLHSKINQSDIIVLHGHNKKRVKDFVDAATDPKTLTLTRGKIFITNYEAMEMPELLELFEQYDPEILVCDEAHRMKNPQAKRAQRVSHLSDYADHRYILTGSPILNSAMDIFMQYRILDGGKTFGTNFYEFRGRYFEDMNAGMPSHIRFPKWVPRQETYELLNKRIYSKALRVLKKDCLDLPPFIRQKIEVDLSPEQRRLYNEMKDDYIAWIHPKLEAMKRTETQFQEWLRENPTPDVKVREAFNAWCAARGIVYEPRAVVAQMALTKTLRLQQIVSGFVKTDQGEEITLKDNPRLDALGDLLEDLTPASKVIVWAKFHENYRSLAALCKKLKIPHVELHGGCTKKEKELAEDKFRGDPETRVMIANQQAAGIGINLVEKKEIVQKGACSYSIYFSKDYSLDADQQSEARNYRGGSEVYESVTRIDLVAPGTIDELILQALAEKQNIADLVLDWEGKL
jgi:SNF2 family DNA or RNA helicase